MLGQIFMQKGQYVEAINRQQRVLSLDPEDGTAQELLQEALAKSKESPAAAAPGPSAEPAKAPAAPAKGTPSSDQSGTIKVAEIYIKKGAFDEAAEVLQEILASDPDNALARQKLQEVNERRGGGQGSKAADDAKAEAEARKKAEEEAKAKSEAEARKKAEEEAKAKAEAEARKKAEEEAKAKAEAEARKKSEEESKAKAEAEARKKAEEEAKAKAEAEAHKKAEDEAKAKADADARKKSEEKAKADAEAEEQKKAAEASKKVREEEAKQREEEEKERKASKLSSDDILSVMTSSSDDLIDEPPSHPGPAKEKAGASGQAPVAPAPEGAKGLSPEARTAIDEFLRAQAMEASMLLDSKGAVLESKVSGDAAVLGSAAGAIFSNTEKAAQRMAFGGLKQIMIVGEDGRQILFVALKAGVLVALTGRNTNLGLLRVAVNDLVKRA
jgi:colicin import membrane protein